MKRAALLAISLALAFAGCSAPRRSSYFDARREFADLLAPQFELVRTSAVPDKEVRGVLGVLSQARAQQATVLQKITHLEFLSPTEVKVSFLWSGGRHAGTYLLRKCDGAWVVVDDSFTASNDRHEPNQAPDPTAMAVTISAFAELAPALSVGHL